MDQNFDTTFLVVLLSNVWVILVICLSNVHRGDDWGWSYQRPISMKRQKARSY